jgi:hypothetical protein
MLTEDKTNRGFIVWSIVMGLLLGFIINVFSSVYYGMYIVGDLQWSQVNHQQLVWCVLALFALVGYLQFFIADYPNTFEFSKAYAKRYQNYFFYSFWPGKIIRWIIGFYLIVFMFVILAGIYYAMYEAAGFAYATVTWSLMIIVIYYRKIIFSDIKKH